MGAVCLLRGEQLLSFRFETIMMERGGKMKMEDLLPLKVCPLNLVFFSYDDDYDAML